MALNLNYSGCCIWSLSSQCNNDGCYCDQQCYNWNDCCSDIADIGCPHPTLSSSPIVSLTPTDTHLPTISTSSISSSIVTPTPDIPGK